MLEQTTSHYSIQVDSLEQDTWEARMQVLVFVVSIWVYEYMEYMRT